MSDGLDTPLSPLSSASSSAFDSDNDDFKAASVTLCFRSSRTPEDNVASSPDKFHANPGSSPLRRSARLSTVIQHGVSKEEGSSDDDDLTSGDEDGIDGISCPNTPIKDQLVQGDEPSSALASRIIRAHDNPSPPPGSTSISASSVRRRSTPVLIDVSAEDAELLHVEGNSFVAPGVSGGHLNVVVFPHDTPRLPSDQDEALDDESGLPMRSPLLHTPIMSSPHSAPFTSRVIEANPTALSPVSRLKIQQPASGTSMDHLSPSDGTPNTPDKQTNQPTIAKPEVHISGTSNLGPFSPTQTTLESSQQTSSEVPEPAWIERLPTTPSLEPFQLCNDKPISPPEIERTTVIPSEPFAEGSSKMTPGFFPVPIITLTSHGESRAPQTPPNAFSQQSTIPGAFVEPDASGGSQPFLRRSSPRRRSVSPRVFEPQATESPRRSPRRSSPRHRSVSPVVFDLQKSRGESESSRGELLQLSPRRTSPRRRSISPLASGSQGSGLTPLPLQVDLPGRRSPQWRNASPQISPRLVDDIFSDLSQSKVPKLDALVNAALGTAEQISVDDQGSEPQSIEQATSNSASNISSYSRALGSLSPDSANVLSGLLASPQPANATDALASKNVTLLEPSTPHRLSPFPVFPHLVATPQPTFPVRFTSPIRGTSPERSPRRHGQTSDVAPPTPARRIPIEQAVAQGHISPQKAAQLKADHGKSAIAGPSRMPIINVPPTDSPARRVVKPTPLPVTPSASLLASRPAIARNIFPEPRPTVRAAGKQKGQSSFLDASKTHEGGTLTPTIPPSASTKRTLPFPLTPSGGQAMPSLATTTRQTLLPLTSGMPSATSGDSPSKSSMLQRTSKIPRMASKPYSKPTASISRNQPTATASSNSTRAVRKVDLLKHTAVSKPSPVKQFRMVQTLPQSSNPQPPQTNAPKSNDLPRSEADSTTATRRTMPTSSSAKRKRDVDKSTASEMLLHPPRPILPMRRVISPSKVAVDQGPSHGGQSAESLGDSADIGVQLHVNSVSDSEMEGTKLTSPGVTECAPIPAEPTLSSVTPIPQPATPFTELSPIEIIQPDAAAEVLAEPGSPPGVRRTRRARKPVIHSTSSDPPEPRPAPTRRKTNGSTSARSQELALGGMTAVALRALTSTNTAKNQAYLVAKLETEVVRKEGARPDSPIMKVKSISQRQAEQRSQMRQARAERRARRSGDEVVGESQEEPQEEDSEWDELPDSPSFCAQNGGGILSACDDDDDDRPPKRPKLNDENEGQTGPRRVKWDRALFETICIDQVKLGTRPRGQLSLVRKGCLAPKAKATQLDVLGNLPETSSPLRDLVEENVVVKKYVYDDEEPVVEPVVEIVVKNTRSRSRRGKT